MRILSWLPAGDVYTGVMVFLPFTPDLSDPLPCVRRYWQRTRSAQGYKASSPRLAVDDLSIVTAIPVDHFSGIWKGRLLNFLLYDIIGRPLARGLGGMVRKL